jgi:hypothetical protein
MTNTDKTPAAKRIYQKPKLRVIELAADEVLAAGCKVESGTSGPGKPVASCVAPGAPCYSPGS